MVRARKRFGQNFLEDRAIIENMVQAIDATNPDSLLEVGPGLGALTQPLLRQGKTLYCLELDRDIVAFLLEKLESYLESYLTIEQGDVLGKPLLQIIKDTKAQVLFSNLPYNISTPFFLKLIFEQVYLPGFFLVQQEVAKRLCANVGSSDYGRLSVMIATGFECEKLFDVPPTAFSPQPKVDSTFIALQPKKSPIKVDDDFEALVRDAFSQRRKKISNTLKHYAVDFHALDLNPASRAQELSLEDYRKIYHWLKR